MFIMLKFDYSEAEFQRSLDLQGTDGEAFRAYMKRNGIDVAEARENFERVRHLQNRRQAEPSSKPRLATPEQNQRRPA